PLSIFERAVILELKVCTTPKEIFTKCDEALHQIEEKRYEDDLNEEGYEDILKYGMSFYRKDCLIKMK
ncbi:MAG: PD-(D/E)XK nuclease domain-containing protein, partial [Clostridium sp.]